jgi:flagellar hook-associated protein 3 FlgL
MPWPTTLGSQALPTQLNRTGLTLRSQLQHHSLELTTGTAADPSRRLRGDLGSLARVETRLQRIAGEESALRRAQLAAESAQAALGKVAALGEAIRDRVMAVATGAPSSAALDRAGDSARSALAGMISALSTEIAGQALFSGAHTDRIPLPDVETLLSAVSVHLAGAATAAAVVAGVDDFFDAPGGPFASQVYAGGTAVAPNGAAAGLAVPLPTAADPPLRAMLREAVLGALLADAGHLPDPRQRQELAVLATGRYPIAAEGLIGVRSRLGQGEAMLDGARLRLSAERDSLLRGRDALVGVDPFDAASRLEETRARLEALYAINARVARLSLTGFLR